MGAAEDIVWELNALRKEGWEVSVNVDGWLSEEEGKALIRQAVALEAIHQTLQAVLDIQLKGSPEILPDEAVRGPIWAWMIFLIIFSMFINGLLWVVWQAVAR